jgi:hypothetical protein
MFQWIKPKSRFLIIAAVVLVSSTLIATFAYRTATTAFVKPSPTATKVVKTPVATPSLAITPTIQPSPTPTPIPSGSILGVESNLLTKYTDIPWVRYGYPTCGVNDLVGDGLKTWITIRHTEGVHVLITTCQVNGAALFDTKIFQAVVESGADAVQCGNEQIKYDPGHTSYVPPDQFAKYFDLCERTVHALRPGIPVLLGSLDPKVGGVDFQGLANQVYYLNAMQAAMNSYVHPGGHWSWRSQTLGMIDSWHNGYPNRYTNSLYGLFLYWAQQFNVNLDSGELGKHIWVVEGTSCYIGCGINPGSPYQVAVSHILTLISDVQTSMRYQVPFFYFSGRDFFYTVIGGTAPFGVDNLDGHPKPLRQDLSMGARSLTMSCANGHVTVIDQEQLLATLYAGCQLPANYLSILTS